MLSPKGEKLPGQAGQCDGTKVATYGFAFDLPTHSILLFLQFIYSHHPMVSSENLQPVPILVSKS